MTGTPEPKSWLSRLVTVCVLFLVAAVALTLALNLLAKIWLWLVLIGVLGGLVAVVIWIVRHRQDHW